MNGSPALIHEHRLERNPRRFGRHIAKRLRNWLTQVVGITDAYQVLDPCPNWWNPVGPIRWANLACPECKTLEKTAIVKNSHCVRDVLLVALRSAVGTSQATSLVDPAFKRESGGGSLRNMFGRSRSGEQALGKKF